MDPRATPAARFALGAAFFLDARFSFLRSALSVVVFVFIRRVLLFLDSCEFFNQLLQSVTLKAYSELSIVALPFAAQYRSQAIFGMPDGGAGTKASLACGGGGWW